MRMSKVLLRYFWQIFVSLIKSVLVSKIDKSEMNIKEKATLEAFFYFSKSNWIKFHKYIYKPRKLWYNGYAKQTKYTVIGCILLFRDIYTLFWLYSFVMNLIKCKFRTRESINIPNLYIVCLATTGICVFVRWLRSAHFYFIFIFWRKKWN